MSTCKNYSMVNFLSNVFNISSLCIFLSDPVNIWSKNMWSGLHYPMESPVEIRMINQSISPQFSVNIYLHGQCLYQPNKWFTCWISQSFNMWESCCGQLLSLKIFINIPSWSLQVFFFDYISGRGDAVPLAFLQRKTF